MLQFIALISFLIIGLIIIYFKIKHNYWEKLNVPYLNPCIPFGNMKNFITSEVTVCQQEAAIYKSFKQMALPYGGYYMMTMPVLAIINLELIKCVLSKDFDYFMGKPYYVNEDVQPLAANLFCLSGLKWKILRQKLTPTFTSGKMKMMFETLLKCSTQLRTSLTQFALSHKPLDIKEIGACYTTDIIASVAFGLECNSLQDPKNAFRQAGRTFFENSFWRSLKILFIYSNQDLARWLKLDDYPKDASNYFMKVFNDNFKYRIQNNTVRNDFMQLLIHLINYGNADEKKLQNESENRITFNEAMAQAFVFFLAGFETSSTTLTFCMFELAQYQDIQDRVRHEIHEVLERYEGKITYESLMELKYMKQVINETLRKYPPLQSLDRKCTRDYQIPNTNIVIKKDTSIMISIFGLHRDPEYFPNPEKFDPERFSDENIDKITPFTYMPFSEGPRTCIGLRFGTMQTKLGLLTLLKDFKFSLNKTTDTNLTFTGDIILNTKNDILLDINKL